MSFVWATVSIDQEGKYGPVEYEVFSTLSAPKTDAITVTKTSVTFDGTNYVVKVAVTGASKVVAHNIGGSDSNLANFENVLIPVHGHKPSYVGLQMLAPEESSATFTFAKNDAKTHLYVSAVNIENNMVSAMAQTTLVIDLAAELEAAPETEPAN